MDDFIQHIVEKLTRAVGTKPEIERKEDDYSITYTIHADAQTYPILIGKQGTTIKAISTLCKMIARRDTNPKRIFISLSEV